MKTIKNSVFYIFPLVAIVYQYTIYPDFVNNFWILYLFGFILLIYSHYRYLRINIEDRSINIRRFYFTYFIFLMILMYPEIEKVNLFSSNSGILGLSSVASVYLICLFCALIIYLIVISDLNIFEISIGNTKISMLKEKYTSDINDHIDLTDTLLDKISAENYVLQNLKKYCLGVRERLSSPDDLFIVTREYQLILEEYFKAQRKENIRVAVLDNINSFREDYCLRSGESDDLAYRMQNNEICGMKKNNVYYLFIPYTYRFEGFKQKIYIVLESETPVIIDAETKIIANILIQFTDELLNLSTIE